MRLLLGLRNSMDWICVWLVEVRPGSSRAVGEISGVILGKVGRKRAKNCKLE